MKLPLVCAQCMHDNIASSKVIAAVELRDDGRYQFTCPMGHSSITILQEQKFEVLFEIGAHAITDGYYREAVSSFAASLERCYEFFVRALLFERGVGKDATDDAWRIVAAQSERQFGAFVLLYSREFGKAPPVLPNKSTAFRNDVVHKGRIPNRTEALQYGQAVLDLIRHIVAEAQEHLPRGVEWTVFQQVATSRLAGDEKQATATMSIGTIVRLAARDAASHRRSLEEAVATLRRWGP